jgi:autotransporter-associated beta strand protein
MPKRGRFRRVFLVLLLIVLNIAVRGEQVMRKYIPEAITRLFRRHEKRQPHARTHRRLLRCECLEQRQMLSAGAVITNGTVELGVNDTGTLIYGGESPDGIGLKYLPSGREALAWVPWALCEGWGVADANNTTVDGWSDTAYGSYNLSTPTFTHTNSTATSVVSVLGALQVTHTFVPSPVTSDLYQIDVQIKNISQTAIGDLRYRRVMDWDVDPTIKFECVSVFGTSSALLYDNNNGFAQPDPLIHFDPIPQFPDDVGEFISMCYDTYHGYHDIGSLFDFHFGSLAAGDTCAFTLFYGAAGSKADAQAALAAVGSEVSSIAWSVDDPVNGTPSTFAFGFSAERRGVPLYWAGDTTTWNPGDTTAHWHEGAPDGQMTTWTSGSTAVFAGTAQTITLTGSTKVGSIVFDTSGYDITGGTLYADPYGTPIVVQTGTDSISSHIADSMPGSVASSIVKSGAGTLILDASYNTYSAGTEIEAGDLEFASSALPSTGLITINTQGALVATGPYTSAQAWLSSGTIVNTSTGALALAGNEGNINLGTSPGYANLSLGAFGSVVYTGHITPGGDTYHLGGGGGTLDVRGTDALTDYYTGQTLAVQGPGTVIISGSNDLSGDATVSSGTLQFGDGTYDGSVAGNIAVNLGANLVFNDSSETYAGVISGQGNVTVGGTLILTNDYDVTGQTTISSYGTLQIGDGCNYYGNNSGTALYGEIEISSYGTLCFDTGYGFAVSYAGHISGYGQIISSECCLSFESTATVDCGITIMLANNAALYVNDESSAGAMITIDSGCYVYANVPSGAAKELSIDGNSQGLLEKSGAGTLGFCCPGASDSYFNIQVDQGTLLVDWGPLYGNVQNNGSIIFDFDGGPYFDGSHACYGTVFGSGDLVKEGDGVLFISSLNYAGTLSIEEGYLWIANANCSGNISIAAGCSLVEFGGTASISGAIGGEGSVIVGNTDLGGGYLTLSGANGYTGGTTVAAGTLELASDGNLDLGSTVYVDAGATFLVSDGSIYDYHVVGHIEGSGVLDVRVGYLAANGWDTTLTILQLPYHLIHV